MFEHTPTNMQAVRLPGSRSKRKFAKLRTCASCEWIFKAKPTDDDPQGVSCPKCQFGSYGAHYCYGSRTHWYWRKQKPWFDKKMFAAESKLRAEIAADTERPKR